jgi:hypothetical protein
VLSGWPARVCSENGQTLKQFKHSLHPNKRIDFIEQFNEKLLVKQGAFVPGTQQQSTHISMRAPSPWLNHALGTTKALYTLSRIRQPPLCLRDAADMNPC